MSAVAKSSHWSETVATLGEWRESEPMARHTTLGVGGPARWYFRPADRRSLALALALIPNDIAILPLGRGSNMLLPDSGFDGVVVDLGSLSELRIGSGWVEAGAGVRMSRMAKQCADHGLTGVEFMATVPGDVGGGVAMNAGAFGQQVSDTLRRIEIVQRSGKPESIAAEALAMGYRHAQLPAGSLVISAEFELASDEPEAIRQRMRDMRERRSASQPLAQANCGSVFKNPEGDYAARLIEAAGLKGLRIGGAQISEKHANFIVNDGQASSADIMALIERAQQMVAEQFGVALQPEVRMIGFGSGGRDE